MKEGNIYNFKGNRIKILTVGDKEVCWDLCNEFGELQSKMKQTIIYYRIDKTFFKENSELILDSALSQEEFKKHRPDLPLRLNCFENIFWTNIELKTLPDFKRFLNSNHISIDKLEGMDAEELFLFPSGQQISTKKPIKIVTNIGRLSGLELLHKCFLIQQQYVNPLKLYFSRFRLISNGREEKRLKGIGLYRLGLKGNIPSYYLGGSISWSELESNKKLIL